MSFPVLHCTASVLFIDTVKDLTKNSLTFHLSGLKWKLDLTLPAVLVGERNNTMENLQLQRK